MAVTRRVVLEAIKGLDVGGAEQLLVSRVACSQMSDYEYHVAYLDSEANQLVERLEAVGISTYDLGRGRLGRLLWPVRLARLARSLDAVVVHNHSPRVAVINRLIFRIPLRRVRPALVTTQHSINYHWLSRLLNRATNILDDATIAVSDAVALSASCRGSIHVRTVIHGVSIDTMQSYVAIARMTAARYRLSERPRIVTVANFRPEKRHDRVLTVAERVLSEEPSAHFYLIGGGPLQSSVQEEIGRRGLSRNVHVLGVVAEAAKIVATADLFLLASDYEGLPVAVMEAAACGIPVVAPDVGGLPEVVSHGVSGILTAPHSEEALATSILTLLSDTSKRFSMGKAAQVLAQQFDITEAARAVEEVFTDAIRQRNLSAQG